MTIKTSSQMPIVNLNGSDPDVLVDAALKTAQALRKALDAMSQSAPHGRDYQTSAGAYTIARREFEERIAEVREIADFYEDMADNIQDQVIDRKRSRALFASPDPLRDEVIRLAHANPELRGDLLPLLKTAKPWYDPEKYKQFSSKSQQEVAAVKDLINMMIQDAPEGKVVDLDDFAKTMGGPAGKAVKKYLPSLMGVGGAWSGNNRSLVWPKDEKGNYDKSKFIILGKK